MEGKDWGREMFGEIDKKTSNQVEASEKPVKF